MGILIFINLRRIDKATKNDSKLAVSEDRGDQESLVSVKPRKDSDFWINHPRRDGEQDR